MIKMFIGNEEVVSDNEFTINEEMLSASSTILNNCYPKSWELTKDYVSNFYYPKDYSKFILGKGNFTYGTEEYSVLNVSGNNFIQFNTNVEKEFAGFNVYGKTIQETRTSTNYFDASKIINTNIQVQENGKKIIMPIVSSGNGITDTGTNLKTLAPNLQVGDIVYLLATNNSNENKLIYLIGSNSSWHFGSSRTITQSDLDSNVSLYANRYSSGETQQVIINDLRIVFNQNNEFMPFGNMPSPEYPSELVSVGYHNIWDEQWENGSFNKITGQPYSINTKIRSKNYISIQPNTQYYVATPITLNAYYYDSNKTFVGANTSAGINGAFTTPDNAYYMMFSTFGSSYSTYSNNIAIFRGTQVRSYIPYGKYNIEIKTYSANYFNAMAIINTNIVVSNNGQTITMPIVSSGNGITDTGANLKTLAPNLKVGDTVYLLATNNSNENKLIYLIGSNSSWRFGTSRTITQSDLDSNVSLYANRYSSGETQQVIINDLRIVKEQNTKWEQFKSKTYLYALNQPLRSIGDTKDLLYIKNGMLYVERKIGSVTFKGTETWNLYSSNTVRTIFYTPISQQMESYTLTSDIPKLMSSHFIPASQNATWKNGDISRRTNENNIYLIVANGYTIDTFKTWLSTHNAEVIYAIQNSTIEELGAIELPASYNGINNVEIITGIDNTNEIDYYWKNYDVLFAGVIKNSGDISLNPRYPHYCSLQVLDYKTFLSESDTLDFVISNKTIREAIEMVVGAISDYNFIVGNIDIEKADDIIGAYSTLNKTAYDVFQYLADISGSRWRARYIDSSSMAIDFYDPDNLPQGKDIEYTKQYWEDENIVDLTFNFGTRDYRNKQVILSDEVFGGIDYTEVILSNGYNTTYITQENIGIVKEITVNGEAKDFITQEEKELGADAEFYYTPGKNIVESSSSYTAGTQIGVVYTPLVKGRQIVYNDEEVSRIAQQTNTIGVIARYENRNDILSSMELDQIGKTYIKYKGKSEVILNLTTQNNDLYNIGEVVYFNAPIPDLRQTYMVKSKKIEYVVIKDVVNLFYTYELTSSFNSEKEINYFDNQRNKMQGNIQEGESITRNIDINSLATIIWGNLNISEVSVSVDGSNVLNSALNSPFIE